MNSHVPISYAILLIAGFAAVWLLWPVLLIVGLRGRRTDDHPLCRRCGFDLTGKPDTTTVCNECGADLARPKAVRVGHRARRRVPLAAGVVLGLLAVGVTALVVTAVVAGQNLNPYKPVWWLLRDTDSRDAATQTQALNELDRRYKAGGMSSGHLGTLVARGLDRQGDRGRPYERQFWSEWIEAERNAGRLTDALWQRYVRQAVATARMDELRKTVRRGDPVPYWTSSGDRAGRNSRLYVTTFRKDVTLSVDGIEVPKKDVGLSSSGSSLASGGRTGSNFDITTIVDKLADGPHTLRVRKKMTVRQGPNDTDPVVCTADTDDSMPFELTSKPTVTFVHDPSLRAGVEAAITMQQLAPQVWSYDKAVNMNYTVNIGSTPVPVGLSCKLSFKSGDREWKAAAGDTASFACPAGKQNYGYGSSVRLAAFPDDVNVVDVVFTPDPSAAVRTTDVFSVWDEPFVVKNVKVVRPTTTPAATTNPTP